MADPHIVQQGIMRAIVCNIKSGIRDAVLEGLRQITRLDPSVDASADVPVVAPPIMDLVAAHHSVASDEADAELGGAALRALALLAARGADEARCTAEHAGQHHVLLPDGLPAPTYPFLRVLVRIVYACGAFFAADAHSVREREETPPCPMQDVDAALCLLATYASYVARVARSSEEEVAGQGSGMVAALLEGVARLFAGAFEAGERGASVERVLGGALGLVRRLALCDKALTLAVLHSLALEDLREEGASEGDDDGDEAAVEAVEAEAAGVPQQVAEVLLDVLYNAHDAFCADTPGGGGGGDGGEAVSLAGSIGLASLAVDVMTVLFSTREAEADLTLLLCSDGVAETMCDVLDAFEAWSMARRPARDTRFLDHIAPTPDNAERTAASRLVQQCLAYLSLTSSAHDTPQLSLSLTPHVGRLTCYFTQYMGSTEEDGKLSLSASRAADTFVYNTSVLPLMRERRQLHGSAH
eukprot:Rhum_TRINITY_DN13441_c0_g1::Rhum_TRINITY_DN13441_c0_g1_i1::g.60199::m.60199